MEIRVQGVHEQGAGVHELSLRPLQPRDGQCTEGTERTSEVTTRTSLGPVRTGFRC